MSVVYLRTSPCLKPFQRLYRDQCAVRDVFLKRIIGFTLGHGHGGCPKCPDDQLACPGRSDLQPLDILQLPDRFAHRMEHARTMGIEIADVNIAQLLGFEFSVELIDDPCRDKGVGIAEGIVDRRYDREPSRRVGENGQTEIRDAFNDPVVDLGGRCQRSSGE